MCSKIMWFSCMERQRYCYTEIRGGTHYHPNSKKKNPHNTFFTMVSLYLRRVNLTNFIVSLALSISIGVSSVIAGIAMSWIMTYGGIMRTLLLDLVHLLRDC
jgi:hypothetical protein